MPVVPPARISGPADDWSDDPSFDLSGDLPFASSTPSSSSSRSSRPSLPRQLSGSPLRQMHRQLSSAALKPAARPSTGTGGQDDDDDDFDFDDFPDALPDKLPAVRTPSQTQSVTPKAPRTMSGASAVSSIRSLSATVIGQGPTGVGTITRLGSKPPPVQLPTGTVKARAKALEKAWEADVDFDDDGGELKLQLPKFAPPRMPVMPEADELDELGFDLDDDDQDTLKAGSTIKAMLPPPRRKEASSSSGTIKPTSLRTPAKASDPKPKPPVEDEDLEGDLVLPLNLQNLTLATQAQQPRKLRPRASMASTVTTDWDSISTPSTSGRRSNHGGFSWGDDSPGRPSRNSETSMTSVSDTPDKGKGKARADFDDDEEDGFEADLVLPDPTFFESGRSKVLNSILDRKRNQHYALQAAATSRSQADDVRDESFEDGLVFDNPRAELSQRRLEKNRRARTIPVPFQLGSDRRSRPSTDKPQPVLGRQSPLPSRGGASGSLGLRSNSGGSQTGLREASSSRRPDSPHVPQRPSSRNSRNAAGANHMSPPPPVPPIPPQHARTGVDGVPSTPSISRLRHQKSFHNLAPAPTPTLVRKQSLASMQDAIAAGHVSRLTMPTTSTLAKMRPPVPRDGSRRPAQLHVVDMPRRTKQWGDGTELEGIEDLVVDSPKSPRSPGYTPRSPNYGTGTPRSPNYSNRLSRKSTEKLPSVAAKTAPQEPERRKSAGKRPRQRKPAMLIKNLGAVDKRKVVGEMTWNPQTLRWEGNDAILRDFDAVASSTRPALITHFTGSSVGGNLNSPSAAASTSVRIVGDMKFDPERMCWVSLKPADEDEPDPFEGLADDEDDEGMRGGTITRSSGRKLVSVGLGPGTTATSGISSRFVSESTSIAASTASWEERTRPQLGTEIPPELWQECRDAEERHKREMRGWVMRPAQSSADMRDRERREEKRLWEVRKLACAIENSERKTASASGRVATSP